MHLRLRDFYEQLNVEATLSPIQPSQIEHIAQMTQHTADFHLTAIQRSTSELNDLLTTHALEGWVIEVHDRFGNYGIAGAVLSAFEKEVMRLDTFLLNCSVLGKRVEYIILNRLVYIARQRGCNKIQIQYRATSRNGLSRTFVTAIGGQSVKPEQDGLSVLLSLETMETFDLISNGTDGHGLQYSLSPVSPVPSFLAIRWQVIPSHAKSDLLTEIATSYQTARQIQGAITEGKQRTRPALVPGFAAPETYIEQTIAGIWQDHLGISNVGLCDNFFELGGHSLLATQIISRLRDAFEVELPLRSIFEAPTVGELARCINAARREPQGLQPPPIKLVPRDRSLPLSFAQQRLWFLSQLQSGSTAYNVPAAIQLSGWVDGSALRQSFNEIVRRHEALRTNFIAIEAHPVQTIATTCSIQLPIVDLTQLSEVERETVARQYAIDEALRPFDLVHDALLRTTLLRLDTNEHILLVTMHHIVSDGWSIGVLIREFEALYNAFSAGRSSPLLDLPLQYADYAVWQREWLRGEIRDKQLDYWKQHLANVPPVLELPFDHSRPDVQSFRGAHHSFQLSLDSTDALKTLSQRENVTLFVTLLATFKVLLHRYSAQDHIVVGTPIANRSRPELESLIGFFANTLVLHTVLSGNPSFKELLRRVREVTLAAYDHQDLPFEMLVADLRVERHLSYNPLFQVLFVFQNTPMLMPRLGELTITPLSIQQDTAILDLTLSMQEAPQGLRGVIEYNTDLFNAHTINQFLSHFKTLLDGILEDADRPIEQLPLMMATERKQLMVSSDADAWKRKKLSAQVKRLLKSKEVPT